MNNSFFKLTLLEINTCRKLSSFFFIFFLFPLSSFAQVGILKHYTLKDGLPSSVIYRGTEDKDGYIWFGTDLGVTRFDGKQFKNFTLTDGLSDNEILVVKQDSKGRVWFLGANGTVSYYLNGRIFNSSNDTTLKYIKSGSSFINFFEDKEGKIWFSSSEYFILANKNKINVFRTSDSNLSPEGVIFDSHLGQIIITRSYGKFNSCIYSGGKFSLFNLHYPKVKNFTVEYRLKDGGVLFQANEGIVFQKDTTQKLIIPLDSSFLSHPLFGIVLTPDNKLWLSFKGKGVFCYNYSDFKQEKNNFLNHSFPINLICDHEGNIWLSTANDGLYMLPAWTSSIKLFTTKDGLSSNKIFSVAKNNKNEIVVGLNNGQAQIIAENKIVSTLNLGENNNNHVLNIQCKGDDRWFATDGGIFHYYDRNQRSRKRFIKINDVFGSANILAIKDISVNANAVYISTHARLCKYNLPYDISEKKPCQIINTTVQRYYSVLAASNNVIWYSTNAGLFSLTNDKIISHISENEFLTKRINDIAETDDSTLVLAIYGYGLLFYKNGKVLHHLTKKDGLASDICKKVFLFKNKIYIATPEGFSIVGYNKNKVEFIRNYTTSNALPSNDVNDVYADDEDVLVATAEGLVVLKQKNISLTPSEIPLLRFNSIKLGERKLDADSSYYFDYTQNSFQFNYIGIYYKSATDVSYRYRLKESENWQFTKNTSIDLVSLSPDNYHFQVQSKIPGGKWSDVKSFNFSIAPPLWKTIEFNVLLFIIVISIAIVSIRWRFKSILKRQKEKASIDKQMNRLEQQALQSMMNPHFIFNVMNSIQQFINSNDKDKANHYLSEFARLIRMNLELSIKQIISLEDEINYLELYLSLEKIRFGERFTYEIMVSSAIDDDETMVPPMMIQPFLENAIWHGILPLQGNGYVKLSIEKTPDNLLRILIVDNGVGIKASPETSQEEKKGKHKSRGMSMTYQRLELIGKTSGKKLSIIYTQTFPEKLNSGTTVELLLPGNL